MYFLWNAVTEKLFQGNTEWPFKNVLFAVRLKCFIMIFIYKLRIPPPPPPPPPWSCQSVLTHNLLAENFKLFSIRSEQPNCITTSSCSTSAEVAVVPIVTLCTDDSSALLWGCTVVLSDPVCSAFNFWEMLCFCGMLHSALQIAYVCVWSSCTCSAQLYCSCTWF